MNSRDWKAKGCECQCRRKECHVSAMTHLVTLALQSRSRDVSETQSPLGRSFGVGKNKSIARKNAFDRSRERLRHGADCTADVLERKAVDIDAHEEKNEPNFCAVIVV